MTKIINDIHKFMKQNRIQNVWRLVENGKGKQTKTNKRKAVQR